MQPPEETIRDDIGLCALSREKWAKEHTDRGPCGSIASSILEAFHECKGDNDKRDQTQDDKAIPRTM